MGAAVEDATRPGLAIDSMAPPLIAPPADISGGGDPEEVPPLAPAALEVTSEAPCCAGAATLAEEEPPSAFAFPVAGPEVAVAAVAPAAGVAVAVSCEERRACLFPNRSGLAAREPAMELPVVMQVVVVVAALSRWGRMCSIFAPVPPPRRRSLRACPAQLDCCRDSF